jgi:hypothetical protein
MCEGDEIGGEPAAEGLVASFHKKATAGVIPELLQSALALILETLETISEQIKNYDRQIEQLSQENYPETEY